MIVHDAPIWKALGWAWIPILELSVVSAGWLYGALNTKKLRPTCFVGHGMFWVSVVVSLALSLRSAYSIRKRSKARLIFLFSHPGYVRFVIGKRSTYVHTEPFLNYRSTSPDIYLAARFLRHVTDDTSAIVSASAVLRMSSFATNIPQYIVESVHKY